MTIPGSQTLKQKAVYFEKRCQELHAEIEVMQEDAAPFRLALAKVERYITEIPPKTPCEVIQPYVLKVIKESTKGA